MRALRSIACVLVCGLPLGACLDLTPLPYEGPEGGGGGSIVDSSVADVVFDVGGPDSPGAACEQCLKTACAAAASACEKNTKCAKFSTCTSATQCWGASLTDLTNLPPCLVNCAVSAGVLGQTDPASALVSPLFSCAQDPSKCASACGVGADR